MQNAIIDVHSHPLFPAFVSALEKSNSDSGKGQMDGVPTPKWSVEEHLKVMDQHGIEAAILSIPDATDHLKGAEGHKLARSFNEELAAIVAGHPQQYGAFAALPMDDMDAALEEMTYALDVLKLDGVYSPTHFEGTYLGEPAYEPWFEEMNRRHVTLFVHPATPPHFNPAAEKINVSVIEFMFETTRMITHMVLSGTKERYPDIKVIATHGGGTIPYLATRLSLAGTMPWAYKNGPHMTAEQILAALKTFYFDDTASFAKPSLDTIFSLIPRNQLLSGFDFPLMPPQTIAPAIASVSSYLGSDDEGKRMIFRENALKLFPRLSRPA